MSLKTTNIKTGVETANGAGVFTDIPQRKTLEKAVAFINVSAASGTSPTLDVDIVEDINGVDHIIASFTQLVAIGKQRLVLPEVPLQLKAVHTITGTTPSFTYIVDVTSDG